MAYKTIDVEMLEGNIQHITIKPGEVRSEHLFDPALDEIRDAVQDTAGVVVDFSAAQYVQANFFGQVYILQRQLVQVSKKLAVYGITDAQLPNLRMTKLDKVLIICKTKHEAYAFVSCQRTLLDHLQRLEREELLGWLKDESGWDLRVTFHHEIRQLCYTRSLNHMGLSLLQINSPPPFARALNYIPGPVAGHILTGKSEISFFITEKEVPPEPCGSTVHTVHPASGSYFEVPMGNTCLAISSLGVNSTWLIILTGIGWEPRKYALESFERTKHQLIYDRVSTLSLLLGFREFLSKVS